MKKFLSLVLALVMTMSLVTISAGAKDFTDDDKITYEEAVAVVSEIGVVDGYADGKFNPTNTLTRQAAAKIICNLILGPTTAAELHADTAPYKDVPATSQFAGYIAYCAKEGIISGYADGTFKPGNTLTGYAFMKMLLGALGYDAEVEGYTGANWSINVAKQAINIGLNKSLEGEFNGIKAVTREEACLYAFNTLKADLVEYDTKTNISVGGAEVVIAGSEAKAMTWNNSATRKTNIKDDNYVQFAEQYFNKLTRENGEDDFGRPTNEWSYNKKDIGSFVNRDLFVTSYTAKVEGGDIYSDIGSVACGYTLTYWVDGEKLDKTDTKTEAAKLAKKNDDTMESTGKGVLTEVYVDNDADETTIVVINTYLAEAIADYSEKTESVRLSVFDGVTPGTEPETKATTYTVKSEDVPAVEGLEEDDLVLVNIAAGKIVVVNDVETVENVEITTYSTGYDDADAKTEYKLTKLTAGGEKYETAKKAYEDASVLFDYNVEQLKDATFDLYLDPYGYVIGARLVDADDQYMFVVGYEESSSYLASAIDEALVIFTDGTMKTVKIKDNDLSAADQTALGLGGTPKGNANVNLWYTYTEKDGVYTLEEKVDKQLADTRTTKLNKENTTVTDGTTVAYGNADSTFIAVKADKDVTTAGSIVKVEDVTTGIRTSSLEVKYTSGLTNYDAAGDKMIFAMYNSNGYITCAVVVGKTAGSSDKLVYLTSNIKSKSLENGDYIWTYEAITKDGPTTVKSLVAKDNGVNHGGTKTNLALGNLYQASFDKDGYITEMEWYADNASMATATFKTDGYAQETVTGTAQKLTVKGLTLYTNAAVNNNYILLADDCNFFVHSSDKDADEFDEYNNVKSALAALGEDTYFTGKIVALVDEAGIATTLILNDTYTANDKAAAPIAPTYVDGAAEGVTAMNGLAQTITVNDRIGDGSTADEIIRDAFTKAGFTVNGNVGTTYYVTAPNGMVQSWNATVTELYPVELAAKAGETWTIESSKTVWLAVSGATVTVTVKSTQAGGFGRDSYLAPTNTVTNGSVTLSAVTRSATDAKLATFTVTLDSITDASKVVKVADIAF